MANADSAHVRLLLRDLSGSFARYDARQNQFQLRDGDIAFSRVRVLGICTQVTLSEQTCKLEIAQDGQWTCITITKDRNAESLRMLEILQLYQQVYTVKTLASAQTATSAATLVLLPFPSTSSGSANSARVKRKHPSTSSPSHSSAATEQHPKTLIEKPRDQHVTNPPQRAAIAAIPNAFAPPPRASVLPAAEYRFNVSASDHEHIENGVKTLEIRLNAPPYSIIRVNDRILVNGRTTATVVAVRKYTQLQSVLQTETLANLLPAAAAAGQIPTLKASTVAIRHFRQFLSAVEEEKHGLVVFELRVGSGAPAVQQKKSPEEWSKLLYEQLAKKRTYGCSMADLQFAFPLLPVDQIVEILTNTCGLFAYRGYVVCLQLQMDGVVYNVQDKYLLL